MGRLLPAVWKASVSPDATLRNLCSLITDRTPGWGRAGWGEYLELCISKPSQAVFMPLVHRVYFELKNMKPKFPA